MILRVTGLGMMNVTSETGRDGSLYMYITLLWNFASLKKAKRILEHFIKLLVNFSKEMIK